MKFKLHHVALSVKNLESSISFYSNLGFEQVFEWTADDNSLKIAHLKGAGGFLELFCYEEVEQIPTASLSIETDLLIIGTKHFALMVSSIEETRKDLIKNKMIPNEIKITQGRTGIQYFFIKDPDGILVEIVQDDRNL